MKFAILFLFSLAACTSPSKNIERSPSQASAPVFTEIVRASADSHRYCPNAKDGETCQATWDQARAYCSEHGGHLPTAREYADLIRPRGTRTLEKNEVAEPVPPGFYFVDCVNPDDSLDGFYMNHDGYKRPSGETEDHLLWTASRPPNHTDFAHVYYDKWGGGGGEPKDHLLTHPNAFQCVANP